MKLLYFFILIPFFSTAQTIINGSLESNDNQKIDFYDIVVLGEDSLMLDSKSFYEANFTLELKTSGNVILSINAFGYKSIYKNLEINQTKNQIDIGKIVLEPLSFYVDAAVITAKRKKPIERINGNLIVNVANSILENEASVEDILKKTPGVILDQNGSVKIIGKGNNAPLVVIDGMESTMEVFNNLHPTQIQSIEIIKNPSALYSANANSVINVTTNNSVYKGWNLKLAGMLTKATFWRYYAGIDLGYNAKKVGFNIHYGYNPNKIKNTDNYTRFFKKENSLLYNYVDVDYKTPHAHYINGKVNFKLTDKMNLNIALDNSIESGENLTINTTDILKDSVHLKKIKTNIEDRYTTYNTTNALNYEYNIDTNGLTFNINSSFSYYANNFNSSINQDSTLSAISSDSKSKLFSIQPSLEVPFKKIKLNTTYGIRYAHTNVDAENFLINKTEEASDINENVFAVFAQANKKLRKFDFNTGLRLEYAHAKALDKNKNTLFEYENINVFPSASINYNFAKNWNAYTSYSYKIDRPNFTSLTSFDTYLDSLSSFKGNAQLVPEYSHLFDLGISFLEVASFDFSFTQTKNPIIWFLETEENTLKSALIQRNFDLKNEYSASLTIPYQTSFWTTYNVLGFTHQNLKSQKEKLTLQNNMVYLVMYNEFNYKKYISFNFTYQYFSKGLFDIYNFEPKHVLNLGLKSTVLKNRLNMYFTWNDIFRTDIYNLSTNLNNIEVSDLKFSDAPLFRLGFTFSLNNAFKNLKEVEKNEDELNRLQKDI